MTAPRRSRSALFRIDRQRGLRRGSVYILVLGVATMIAVVGLGTIALARSGSRVTVAERDWAEAGTLALSGIELALAEMNTSTSWRSSGSSIYSIGPVALGNGRISVTIADETDSDLGNNTTDPVRITSTATVRAATRAYSVLAAPSGSTGMDVLRCAVHSNANVTVSDSVTVSSGPLSTNATFSNSSTPTTDVEAKAVSSSGTINGYVLVDAPQKAMPSDSAWQSLSAVATTISFSSLSGGTMDEVLLTPGSNPFGVPNARGVYTITVPLASTLTIRRSRLQATLLIRLSSLSQVIVRDEVCWDPGAPTQPALIIQTSLSNTIALGGSTAVLSESDRGVNLNPAGSPYGSLTNSTKTDTYPAQITGVIHVLGASGSVQLRDSIAVNGCVIAECPVTISSQARLTANPTLLNSPPAGFGSSVIMKPMTGTHRWEVAQ